MAKRGCNVILCSFIECILWFAIHTWSLNNSTGPIPNVLKPNILFILVDDLGWNDIGFHGSSDFSTPNIDNLATNHGLQLNNYYVNSLCTPTRAALLSGRYSIRTGMQHAVLNPTDTYGLPLQFTLLSQDLQRAGYDTYLFGKWHLGYFNERYTPTFRGFNTFCGFYNGAESFFNHTVTVDYNGKTYPRYDLMDNTQPVEDARLTTYSTFVYGNKTLDVLRTFSDNTDAQKQPFFIYLSLQNVHSPLEAPSEVVDTIQINDANRRIKAAKATIVDRMIGDIVQELDDTGLWQNVLILFSTDNGAPSEDGGSNFPLRGSKGTLWEGGVRGTAFISGGYLHASRYGQVSNELLHVTDFYPTICDIVGINATDHDDLDGESFASLLQQENGTSVTSPRHEVLLNIDPVQCNNSWNVCGGIRIGDWKLLVGNVGNQVTKLRDPHSAIDNLCMAAWCTNTDFTYHDTSLLSTATVQCALNHNITQLLDATSIYNTCPFNGEPCLFNIKEDPCEFYDVKANHTEILNHAMERLQFWNTQTLTPLNMLNAEVDPIDMPSHTHWVPWKPGSEMVMWNSGVSSANPTVEPTLEPTMITRTPTQSPTLVPSSETPTSSPSHAPVVSSTDSTTPPPSQSTESSTLSPSQTPTMSPVMRTTVLSTDNPTVNPSSAPLVSTTMEVIYSTTDPSRTPTQIPTSSPSTQLPTESPITTLYPTTAPSSAPTIAPTHIPIANRVVTEVPSKGKKEYMTSFYLVSILSIVACGCVICIGVCYKRSKSRNTQRHRRLQDALRGIELRTIIQRPPGGGEYSGLLN